MSVRVETITVGVFESNCHILHRDGSHDALVVDPGGDADTIIGFLRQEKLRVAAYLVTHGHMDHVYALAEVSEEFPAPIGLHPLDSAWAFTNANAMLPWYNTPRAPRQLERHWAEGQIWTDAGLAYTIIETPGHSPGSVSFHFKDEALLFSGDVLFAGGIGRSDLPGGSAPTLLNSLRRLIALPDETRVFSGHGPATTIAREKKSNPFLRDTSWAETD